jgi:hypothetical protein
MPPTLVQKLNTWPVRCYYNLRPPHLLFLSPRFCFWCVHSVHKYMYIYIFTYVNVQEKHHALTFPCPHPWLQRAGVPMLGSCVQHFCSEGCLP